MIKNYNSKIDLSVNLAGLKLQNPLMPAAGPSSRDGETLLKSARAGIGCVVCKTVSVKPAPVPRPNMMVVDRATLTSYQYISINGNTYKISKSELQTKSGILNTELWTEKSLEEWLEKEYYVAHKSALPMIASVGYTPEDMKIIIPKISKLGFIDAVEFSTHYIKPGLIRDITKTIKKYFKGKVFAKLSPHNPETLIEQAKEAETAGCDGIVAINSFGPTLHFDIDSCKPLLGSKFGYGWISGVPIKPLAVRCVFDIARNVKIPVIGVGGIFSGRDVIEHIMAGATAVQICTAYILEGVKVYPRILKEIIDWMKKNNVQSLSEIRGKYIKKIGNGQKVRTKGGYSKVDNDLCKGCHSCEPSCVYGAISFKQKDEFHEVCFIDKNKCQACGLCVSICPTRAINIVW